VRSEKAAVITWALEQLEARGVDVRRPVMIGDRIHDVEGAAAHGIPTVFAEWGYGSPDEAVVAAASAATPAELPRVVLRNRSMSPVNGV
jgi:phosphoglycolate phosphatase